MTVDNLTWVNYSVEPLGQQSMPSRDGYLTILTTSMPNRHFKLSSTKNGGADAHQANIARRHLFYCVYTIPSTDIKQSRVLELYPGRSEPFHLVAIACLLTWANATEKFGSYHSFRSDLSSDPQRDTCQQGPR